MLWLDVTNSEMVIKNLAKMLFKSWLVSLALSMILVGLSESFGKTSHPTAGGLLVERVLAETAGLWLFVFLALFLAFVVIKATRGRVIEPVKAEDPVQGKVRWFSREKGYGYIVDDDGKEYYFDIHDIQGGNIPFNGDFVTFVSSQGAKGPRASGAEGPRASSVVIDQNSQSTTVNRSTDERVTCTHCGKKMMPRLIISQGSPSYSVCPFCAGVYKDFTKNPCFIATAVYGDYYAPEVIALRRFRDESLNPYTVGRIFIKTYYKLSPPIAKFVSQHHLLASAIRPLLDALARCNLKRESLRFERGVK